MSERCQKTWGLTGAQCILDHGHADAGREDGYPPEPHLYRCCGQSCPGLPWAPSAVPHPVNCCRQIGATDGRP